jgi:hypothetical protein
MQGNEKPDQVWDRPGRGLTIPVRAYQAEWKPPREVSRIKHPNSVSK